MLAIRSKDSVPTCIANLLPCHLHDSGPAIATRRHWRPEPTPIGPLKILLSARSDTTTLIPAAARLAEIVPDQALADKKTKEAVSTQTSYFRGRKLIGVIVPLPEAYTGAVLDSTGEVVGDEEEEEEEEERPETKVFSRLARFDEVVVWAHEEVPKEQKCKVLKGLNEWTEWAARIHDWDDDEEEGKGEVEVIEVRD